MITEKRNKKYLEIEKSIEGASSKLDKFKKKSTLIGWLRVVVFFLGVFTFFILYFLSLKIIAFVCLFIFLIPFIFISVLQSKILKSIKKFEVWIKINKTNLSRSKLDWLNIPPHKIFNQAEPSQIEVDLDLTGNRSLHQLMDVSKSMEGSLLLRKLLIDMPVSRNEIIKRQNIVKEINSLSHFRNRFQLIGELSSKKELDTNTLVKWLSVQNKTSLLKNRFYLLWLICLINLLFVGLAVTGIVSTLYVITLFLYVSAYYLNYKHIGSLSLDLDIINDELKKIIGIISFIEEYNYGNRKNLIELCKPLIGSEKSPTKQIKKINNVFTILSFQKNPFLWMFFTLVFPLDYFLMYRVEIYKQNILKNLPDWLDVWYKLEAYVSIANFANLNPDYTFPEINSDENKIKLITKAIGHPLLSHEQKIRNNYNINKIGSISLITGSNMSGKSTFLRTVGINMCLAYMGAPVDAELFSTGLVRIFTCIRLSDSVIDGISYFYAEVKRLKKLLDIIEEKDKPVVLYFIDEIFRGTNNIERLQGSRALVKLLAGKNGAGLISTHDLELVNLSTEIPSITNYHFREEVENETMLFDYKLREGPCPTTNALKIIKANGLPID